MLSRGYLPPASPAVYWLRGCLVCMSHTAQGEIVDKAKVKIVTYFAKEKCWQHHRIDCPVWFCRMRQGDHDKPIVATKELTK